MCVHYGFKENPHYNQKIISLDVFGIKEPLTLKYIPPRVAIIRLLRSMNWSQFDLEADLNSYQNENFREFFSGKWAKEAQHQVRAEFSKRGIEKVNLLGIIIMTDSSMINIRRSKKPFYIALANCHYSYRNNLTSMESLCKTKNVVFLIFRLYARSPPHKKRKFY